MFFEEDDDDRFLNPELYHIVSRELFAIGSHFEFSNDSSPFALRSAPTHTEDGIPIRKLYVSNLPPKTTRADLFGVFAQYGFIKSCWLRMGEKGPHRCPTPTYAFVTYTNPQDAHKALQAPVHEKTLRGRNLHTSPADSWHQPALDDDGQVRWKPRSIWRKKAPKEDNDSNSSMSEDVPEASTAEPETVEEPEEMAVCDESYNILDILNRDCLMHILDYVPITELIRSERVSKRWQSMVQEYLQGVRTFKTSWWNGAPAALTTAVLRRVLQRAGAALTRLHIDHNWSALNDRTAHTIGKFCPHLEELKVIGMLTKNWNPLIYGCKQLKILSFISCNKLTDSSLIQIVKSDSCIEKLTIANNTHVTGLFLTGSNPPKLSSLAFYNCYSLQGTVLCAAIDALPNLTVLRLDVCPVSMWKVIPSILKKLPGLLELSLSEYMAAETGAQNNDDFCESIATLTELRELNLFNNVYVTNAVLKQVAQTCTKLEVLNVASCNGRKCTPGVGDEGLAAICQSCRELRRLDVSYLARLTDAGLRAACLPRLACLTARGNPQLSSAPVAAALAACPHLQEVDLCGCDGVSEEVACAARRAILLRPRAVLLRLAGTAAEQAEDIARHKLLTVNISDDLSNQHLRPDFVDNVFEDSSEDSFDDLYDHEDFDQFFFPPSDEEFMDDDGNEYDDIHAYGFNGQDVILL